MRKTNRLWAICLALMFMFCMSVSFTGCGESELSEPVVGPIPDGTYYCFDINGDIATYIYAESSSSELYWVIEGDDASLYSSGWLSNRAKVVEKDGKIYIECYRWTTIIHTIADLLMGASDEIGFNKYLFGGL